MGYRNLPDTIYESRSRPTRDTRLAGAFMYFQLLALKTIKSALFVGLVTILIFSAQSSPKPVSYTVHEGGKKWFERKIESLQTFF